jgi:hypothetical protein
MMRTANRSPLLTAWQDVAADELGALKLRAIRDAEYALTSDVERCGFGWFFDSSRTSNFPDPSAYPTASGHWGVLDRIVRELIELVAAIAQTGSATATDQYLYEDQAPIHVPDDWFAELRKAKVIEDADFELPWADG